MLKKVSFRLLYYSGYTCIVKLLNKIFNNIIFFCTSFQLSSLHQNYKSSSTYKMNKIFPKPFIFRAIVKCKQEMNMSTLSSRPSSTSTSPSIKLKVISFGVWSSEFYMRIHWITTTTIYWHYMKQKFIENKCQCSVLFWFWKQPIIIIINIMLHQLYKNIH